MKGRKEKSESKKDENHESVQSIHMNILKHKQTTLDSIKFNTVWGWVATAPHWTLLIYLYYFALLVQYKALGPHTY